MGYCLWRDGARIIVCDGGGTVTPQIREPGHSEEGGRSLQVEDMIAAAWGHFRVGHAQAVWCDLGKPVNAVPRDTWAWLPGVISAVSLAPDDPGRELLRFPA